MLQNSSDLIAKLLVCYFYSFEAQFKISSDTVIGVTLS